MEEGASLNLICLAELAQGGSADVRGDLQINGMVRSEGGTLAVNGGSVTGGGCCGLHLPIRRACRRAAPST